MDVAIVGMAGRFPGSENLEQFWKNLSEGVESISFHSDEELLAQGVGKSLLENPRYVKASSVLDGIELFDAKFFGLTPKEAEITDPQHRILLELAFEALETAGYCAEKYDGEIGVFAGVGKPSYLINNIIFNLDVIRQAGNLPLTIGNDKSYCCTRISHKLNLKGPSVSVDTACSTSLVSVHLGCKSLLDFECDIALAGGAQVNSHNEAGYLFEDGGIKSNDGHCRAFDALGSGTIFGSGAGMVVLKRLEDAINDGDTIYAVIKGSTVNNDGSRKVGFTAPSVEGQRNAICQAQAIAEVSSESISYIEAHGTGTALGDPIEIAALTDAFRIETDKKGFCAIGSLKTNVGHLETAAGVAAVIKTVLALQHKQIPPSLHFKNPNPEIDFASSPFYVNTELRSWERDGSPLRAGVSSFGIGGTNAHIILEESPQEPLSESSAKPWHLIPVSAKTEKALIAATNNLANHLTLHPALSTGDVAFTLQQGRKEFEYRAALICQRTEDALHILKEENSSRIFRGMAHDITPAVYFMFPGQGSQHIDMTVELYNNEPHFRETLDFCAEQLKEKLGSDLRDIVFAKDSGNSELLNQTEITQPVLFAIEYSVASLWKSWGVTPKAMIGHSLGEYVAATLAGVFSVEEALNLVYLRAQVMQKVSKGAMLAVSASEQDVSQFLKNWAPNCCLAAVNGPTSSVVSGPVDDIVALEGKLEAQQTPTTRLHTSHAFHSSMMDSVLDAFERHVQTVTLKAPAIPFISNVTGTWISAKEATDPLYWVRHLRQGVRFSDGIQTLLKEKEALFLEIGPGQTLTALVRQHAISTPQSVLSSCPHPRSKQSGYAFLLTTAAQLWTQGIEINWSSLYQNEKRRRIPLPTYPFERQRFWIERNPTTASRQAPPSPALTKKEDIADWFYIPSWKRLPPFPIQQTDLIHQHWLIFADGAGLGLRLAESLRQKNATVVTVLPGQTFEHHGQYQYTINPNSPEDYSLLFKRLLATSESTVLARPKVVYMWPLDSSSKLSSSSELNPFLNLRSMATAIVDVPDFELTDITVITNTIHSIIGDEDVNVPGNVVLGACKVISQEVGVPTKNIDIRLAPTHSTANLELDPLIKDLCSQEPIPIVAHRNGMRWAVFYEPVAPAKTVEPSSKIRAMGVYVILGGTGQLGLAAARWLATKKPVRIILVSRTFPSLDTANSSQDAKTEAAKSAIKELQALGTQVFIQRADISDSAQGNALLDYIYDEFGEVNGIIHAAGRSVFKPIQTMSLGDCDEQFGAKLSGVGIVSALMEKSRELDFCFLFSSLSSILGGSGHFAYSGANSCLDAFAARHFNFGDRRVVSINWDSWGLPNRMAGEIGSGSISTEDSYKVLDHFLTNSLGCQVIVTPVNLAERFTRWVINPLRQTTRTQKKIDVAESNSADAAEVTISASDSPRTQLEKNVQDIWVRVLGIADIGIFDNFFEIGGDSLLGMRVINAIQEKANSTVHITALLEFPTISSLSEYLEKNYFNSELNVDGADSRDNIIIDQDLLNRFSTGFRSSLTPLSESGQKNSRAIFLLSPPRSGSTLLRAMLAGHNGLFSPPELELLKFNNLGERWNASLESSTMFEGVIEALMNIHSCSAEQAYALMRKYENAKLPIKDFYAQIQKWIEPRILVDKTPSYAFNGETLARAEAYFENAFYIHLTRHPAGMIRSFENAKLDLMVTRRVRENIPFGRKTLGELIWLLAETNIQKFLRAIPSNRKQFIKFEDLVHDPERVLRELCASLDLAFDQSMLNPYADKRQRMTGGVHQESRTIGDPNFHKHSMVDAGIADEWKRDPSQIMLSELTWKVAETYGYSPSHSKDEASQSVARMASSEGNANIDSELLESVQSLSEEEVGSLLENLLRQGKG